MMGKTDGDNYTLDDMFVSSAAQREGEGMEEERMRSRAIGESRRMAVSLEKCHHCFSSQELQKHLIVAIGSKVRHCECGAPLLDGMSELYSLFPKAFVFQCIVKSDIQWQRRLTQAQTETCHGT